MQLALRERTDHATGFAAKLLFGWRYWAVIGASVVLFSIAGPFGTFEQAGVGRRALYWAATMTATSITATAVIAVVSAAVPKRHRTSFAIILLGSLVSCLPNTLVVSALIPPLLDVPAPPLPTLLLYVLPVGLAIGTVTYLAFGAPAGGEEPISPALNPLLERLRVEKRGPVVRMSMQDHYVEVVTTRGRELVLMRMADAAAAMGETGLRIHRSHWVARDHVACARREGAQAVVTASDGAELPVSRSYVADLKAAGLL